MQIINKKQFIDLDEAANILGMTSKWLREKRVKFPEYFPRVYRETDARTSKIYFKRTEFSSWHKNTLKEKNNLISLQEVSDKMKMNYYTFRKYIMSSLEDFPSSRKYILSKNPVKYFKKQEVNKWIKENKK